MSSPKHYKNIFDLFGDLPPITGDKLSFAKSVKTHIDNMLESESLFKNACFAVIFSYYFNGGYSSIVYQQLTYLLDNGFGFLDGNDSDSYTKDCIKDKEFLELEFYLTKKLKTDLAKDYGFSDITSTYNSPISCFC